MSTWRSAVPCPGPSCSRVLAATYHQVWWPATGRCGSMGRAAVWDEANRSLSRSLHRGSPAHLGPGPRRHRLRGPAAACRPVRGQVRRPGRPGRVGDVGAMHRLPDQVPDQAGRPTATRPTPAPNASMRPGSPRHCGSSHARRGAPTGCATVSRLEPQAGLRPGALQGQGSRPGVPRLRRTARPGLAQVVRQDPRRPPRRSEDWLTATLGISATDPSRYAWEPVTPGDPDHMEPARRLLHVVADRPLAWRTLVRRKAPAGEAGTFGNRGALTAAGVMTGRCPTAGRGPGGPTARDNRTIHSAVDRERRIGFLQRRPTRTDTLKSALPRVHPGGLGRDMGPPGGGSLMVQSDASAASASCRPAAGRLVTKGPDGSTDPPPDFARKTGAEGWLTLKLKRRFIRGDWTNPDGGRMPFRPVRPRPGSLSGPDCGLRRSSCIAICCAGTRPGVRPGRHRVLRRRPRHGDGATASLFDAEASARSRRPRHTGCSRHFQSRR